MRAAVVFSAAVMALSSASPAMQPDHPAVAGARWHIEHTADPMTDARKVSLTLQAPPGEILIVCDSGDAIPARQITIGMGRHLGGRPIVRGVMLRFDNNASITANWGHTGRFIVSMADAASLVRDIARSQRMAVRATDYRGARVDMIFDLTGSAEAVRLFDVGCAEIGL